MILKKEDKFCFVQFWAGFRGVVVKQNNPSAYICVWTLEHLCQSLSSELGLLLRDHGPRVGGGGRLKDGLPVVRPRPG